MPFFLPNCYRCGKHFTVGDKAEIITLGTVTVTDLTTTPPTVKLQEKRVLVCEAPCV